MKILVPVVLALLSVDASAERANKPFNTANGRTAQGNSPAPAAVAAQGGGGGAAANGPAAAPAAPGLRAGVMVYGPGQTRRVSSGRGIRGGGGGHTAGKSIGFVGARRATGSGAGQGVGGVGPKTAAEEEAPPNFSKPGALIRDTGQLPLYEKTTTGTHTVDAGEIVMNNRKAVDIGKAPSLQQGPKDTPPPPNPGTWGGSYTTGAAANSPGGSSGSSGSSGSGKDNNGSGNNGKGTDSPDGHGNDKTHDSTFDDPTGFNAAF